MFTTMSRCFGFSLIVALLFSFLAAPSSVTASVPDDGATREYVVVFSQPSGLPAQVDRIVASAGGTVTVRLPEIGAIGAQSADPNFAANVAAHPSVQTVSLDIVTQMIPDHFALDASHSDNNGGTESPPGPDPQPMPDNLGREQWDKMRLNATLSGSYAVEPGRKDVVVAVLDTGAEVLPVAHPDIAPNLDFARSRSFVDSATGAALAVADPNPASWDDRHGHGSWCLSAVGAPINVAGISGVAPGVTLVALKVLGDTGRGSFLGVANALVYSGINKFDVASMSLGGYFNHSDFNAIYVVLNRATQFARSNGVLPVAALANNNFDLSDGQFFRDFIEAPGEIPGVVGVSATGYYNQKAFYSNYGVGATDISAPGGSTRDASGVPGSGVGPPSQPAPYRGQGRVLGAWSVETIGSFSPVLTEEDCDPATGNCGVYAWVQGTSMATPNAAGVAALIISQYGDFETKSPQMGHMPPTEVESILQITANNQPCPEPGTFTGGPGFTSADNDCEGNTGYNNFFGKGIVDALKAVTYYNNQ
ncbi:MAG: S8 family serine peptidase [Chloroflexota bacterium]|nr:S8 family serine peptidase [Chloroflexota bacterium]